MESTSRSSSSVVDHGRFPINNVFVALLGSLDALIQNYQAVDNKGMWCHTPLNLFSLTRCLSSLFNGLVMKLAGT